MIGQLTGMGLARLTQGVNKPVRHNQVVGLFGLQAPAAMSEEQKDVRHLYVDGPRRFASHVGCTISSIVHICNSKLVICSPERRLRVLVSRLSFAVTH